MADTNASETILLTIKVSQEDVEKQILADRAALVQLKSALSDLNKEYKNKAISATEYAKSQQAISTQIKAANASLKAGEKTLDDYAKTQKAAEGSLEQMRAQLALLAPKYAALSAEQRDNSEEGQALLKTYADLTNSLKDLEKAYGSTGRNVGNYGDTFSKAAEGVEALTVAESKNTSEVNKGQKSVTDYIKSVNVMGVNVGDVSEKFKSGSTGVATFAKGIFTARGALIALTAVPIILVLTAIVSFFQRSKEGMELFGAKTAAVTAVIDLFFSKIVSLGKSLIEAFSSPGEAIKKLGELITENLTNRLSAFKVILDGIKIADFSAIRDGLIQLFTGVEGAGAKVGALAEEARRAAAAGEAVARQAYAIADAERQLNIERAKSRAQVEALKQVGDDVSKSNEVRLQATLQAYAIENGLLQKQQALQKQKIENIKAENKLRGAPTKEGLDKLAEAQQRYSELAEESTTRQIELNNKLNQIRIEGQRAVAGLNVANAEAALTKAREQGIKNELELFELEKDLLNKKLALELVGVVKGSEAEKAIRLRYRDELAELDRKSVTAEGVRLSAIRTAELKRRLAQAVANSEEEFNLRQGLIQQEYLDQVESANATIKNKEELNKRLLELDAQYAKDSEELARQHRAVQLDQDQALIDARLIKQKDGSRKQLDLILAGLEIERKRKIDAAKGDTKAIEAIEEESRNKKQKANEAYQDSIINMITDSVSRATSALSTLLDGQTNAQINALDAQQKAILSSASLSADARLQIEGDFQKKKDKIEKAAAEKRKKIALAENLIAIARGITEAWKLPPPFNFINAALVVAAGAAQQIVIDNQKFATGGVYRSDRKGAYVTGPGSGTSDSINAQISNGEAIINAKSTAKYYSLLSAINQSEGGKPFPGVAGAKAPVFSTDNVLPRYVGGGVNIGMDETSIANAVREAIKDLRPVVRVVDMNDAQAARARVEVSNDH